MSVLVVDIVSEPFRTVMGDNFGGAVMLFVYVGEGRGYL